MPQVNMHARLHDCADTVEWHITHTQGVGRSEPMGSSSIGQLLCMGQALHMFQKIPEKIDCIWCCECRLFVYCVGGSAE